MLKRFATLFSTALLVAFAAPAFAQHLAQTQGYQDTYEPNTAPNYVTANSSATLSALTLSSPLTTGSGGTGAVAPTAFASLPACGSTGKGLIDTVTDSANRCAAGNSLAGGGANVCEVLCNGGTWQIVGTAAAGSSNPSGWPLAAYFTGHRTVSNWGCTVNGSCLVGIVFPAAVTFGHLDIIVNTLRTAWAATATMWACITRPEHCRRIPERSI